MGYRSDVGLVLKRKDFSKIVEKASDGLISLLSVAETKFFEEYDAIVLHWDWIKWYQSFPEVEEIEHFIYEEAEGGYRFCRVGEDIEDIEVNQDYDNRENNWGFYELVEIPKYVITADGGDLIKLDKDRKIDFI